MFLIAVYLADIFIMGLYGDFDFTAFYFENTDVRIELASLEESLHIL